MIHWNLVNAPFLRVAGFGVDIWMDGHTNLKLEIVTCIFIFNGSKYALSRHALTLH